MTSEWIHHNKHHHLLFTKTHFGTKYLDLINTIQTVYCTTCIFEYRHDLKWKTDALLKGVNWRYKIVKIKCLSEVGGSQSKGWRRSYPSSTNKRRPYNNWQMISLETWSSLTPICPLLSIRWKPGCDQRYWNIFCQSISPLPGIIPNYRTVSHLGN